MSKKDEALKLAQNYISRLARNLQMDSASEAAKLLETIDEALAEQPAIKQDLTPEQPAQQINPETRTKDGLKYSPNYVAGYNDGLKAAQQQYASRAEQDLYEDEDEQPEQQEPDYKALWQQMCERCDVLDAKLAQQWKPLVWLTDEEAIFLIENESLGRGELIDAIEAKLREKNA